MNTSNLAPCERDDNTTACESAATSPEVLVIHVAPPDLLTSKQAAEILGVSERTLSRMQARGDITAVSAGVNGKVSTYRAVDVHSVRLPRSVRHTYGSPVRDLEARTVSTSPRRGVVSSNQQCKRAHPSSVGEVVTTPPASISQGLRMSHGPRQIAVPLLVPRAVAESVLPLLENWTPERATKVWTLLGWLTNTKVRQSQKQHERFWTKRLREAMGRYEDALDPLIEAGIIFRTKAYRNLNGKGTAKGYRLLLRGWKGSPLAAVYLHKDTEERIAKALERPVKAPTVRRRRLANGEYTPPTTDPMLFLQEHYGHTEIDVQHVLRLIAKVHDLSPAVQRRYVGDTSLEGLLLLSSKVGGSGPAQSGVLSVYKWLTDRQPLSRDSKVRRVHSAVTNLHTAFRPAVRLHGSDRLVALDLKGSQLWLFACEMAKDEVGKTEDGRRFIEWCVSADPYSEFHNLAFGFYPTPQERFEYKRTFFRTVYYARRGNQSTSPEAHWFRKEFPNVHEYILRKKAKSYKDFPIAMQLKESSIFIDSMVPLFAAAEVPLLTIHDSVLVHEAHADTAEDFMRRALAPLGLYPTIKREAMWLL